PGQRSANSAVGGTAGCWAVAAAAASRPRPVSMIRRTWPASRTQASIRTLPRWRGANLARFPSTNQGGARTNSVDTIPGCHAARSACGAVHRWSGIVQSSGVSDGPGSAQQHCVLQRARDTGLPRRNDEAFVGDDHPAAVLPPDLLDAASAGQDGAGLDLDDAAAAFDQGDAVEPLAHNVVVDDRGLRRRLRLDCRRTRRDRAGDL